MSIIAKNLDTGDCLEDLGMRGEYPYSSEVGRRVTIGGKTEEWWYATEINPRGKTQVDADTEAWIREIQPTKSLRRMVGYTRYIEVTLNGNGARLHPEAQCSGGEVVWNNKRGYLSTCPHVIEACKALLQENT